MYTLVYFPSAMMRAWTTVFWKSPFAGPFASILPVYDAALPGAEPHLRIGGPLALPVGLRGVHVQQERPAPAGLVVGDEVELHGEPLGQCLGQDDGELGRLADPEPTGALPLGDFGVPFLELESAGEVSHVVAGVVVVEEHPVAGHEVEVHERALRRPSSGFAAGAAALSEAVAVERRPGQQRAEPVDGAASVAGRRRPAAALRCAPSIALLSVSVAFWIALSSAVRLTASFSRLPNWASAVAGQAADHQGSEEKCGHH